MWDVGCGVWGVPTSGGAQGQGSLTPASLVARSLWSLTACPLPFPPLPPPPTHPPTHPHRRTLAFLHEYPAAALTFYSHVHHHLPLSTVTRVILVLHKGVRISLQKVYTRIQEHRASLGEAARRAAKKGTHAACRNCVHSTPTPTPAPFSPFLLFSVLPKFPCTHARAHTHMCMTHQLLLFLQFLPIGMDPPLLPRPILLTAVMLFVHCPPHQPLPPLPHAHHHQ
jgi:hypothetical protein